MEPIEALDLEQVAVEVTDNAYQSARDEWEEISARYAELRGNSSGNLGEITGLIKKYAPTTAKYLGGPAAGAAVATMLANDGGFSKVIGTVSKIFG